MASASGIAELYAATDPLLHRPVAIKVLSERLAADTEAATRFARKALAVARLSGDRQIVTIYEVGEAAGRPFIVMEFLSGGSLEDVLREDGVQEPRRAISWLDEAACALDWAHERGLVHGDVKPSNLVFDEAGHVHVTDFGLVDAIGPDASTVTSYRAPEQADGVAAGPAADEYALALIGLELLTGSRPFGTEWPATEAAAHHARITTTTLSSERIPATARAVFDGALATRPSDRFDTCGKFVAALARAFAEEGRPTVVRPPAAAPPRRGWQTRVGILAGLLLLVTGGALAAIAATHHKPDATRVAEITVSRPGATVRETVTAEAPAVTVHDTVTIQAPAPLGTTVVQTVTAQTETTTMKAPAVTAAPEAGGSSASLALAGYRRLQKGDATGALPLLRAAAARLDGTHTLAEAYNDYNLALAITKTQGCGAQTRQLLEESESIQGHRSEIDDLRRVCNGRG